jgi:hypothetical protein
MEPAVSRNRIPIYKCLWRRYERSVTKTNLADIPVMNRPEKITIQASHGLHFIARRTPA